MLRSPCAIKEPSPCANRSNTVRDGWRVDPHRHRHRDDGGAVREVRRGEMATWRRELGRIVEKVRDNLRQSNDVTLYHHFAGAASH